MPLEPAERSPSPPDTETRLRVLEEIAVGTKAAIERLDRQIEAFRIENSAEHRALRAEHRADFRLLMGLILTTTGAMLAVMAHGFHWFP